MDKLGSVAGISYSIKFTCIQSENMRTSQFNGLAFGTPGYALDSGMLAIVS